MVVSVSPLWQVDLTMQSPSLEMVCMYASCPVCKGPHYFSSGNIERWGWPYVLWHTCIIRREKYISSLDQGKIFSRKYVHHWLWGLLITLQREYSGCKAHSYLPDVRMWFMHIILLVRDKAVEIYSCQQIFFWCKPDCKKANQKFVESPRNKVIIECVSWRSLKI